MSKNLPRHRRQAARKAKADRKAALFSLTIAACAIAVATLPVFLLG